MPSDGLLVVDTVPGGSSQNFIWNTLGSIPQLLEDGTNYYIYGPNVVSAPLEQISISGSTPSYLVSDETGVREQISPSGGLDGANAYDAYGNCSGCTADTPFGYAGAYTVSTGLLYLINRYYDPTTGQFVSVDPDVSQTGQPYAYTDDDPVNSSDPLGLCDPSSCGNQSAQTQINEAYADMSQEVVLSYDLDFCEETLGAEVNDEYITSQLTKSPGLFERYTNLSREYVEAVAPLVYQLANVGYDAVSTFKAFNMKADSIEAAMDTQNSFVAAGSSNSAVVDQEASELSQEIGVAAGSQLAFYATYLGAVTGGDALGPSIGMLLAYLLD
jgi:RHS repeat-associated protein